jgi:hypothetical protein
MSCGLDREDTAWCWGTDLDEYRMDQYPTYAMSSLSLQLRWGCGILEGGALVCWGIYDNYRPTDWDSVTLPVGPMQSIAVGYLVACAVSVDGELSCFDGQGRPYTDGVP